MLFTASLYLKDGSADAGAEFDSSIAKLSSEIERMAPNMKAMERFVHYRQIFYSRSKSHPSLFSSLDDVQVKLAETEKEADRARKDSKHARDEFNDVRKRR